MGENDISHGVLCAAFEDGEYKPLGEIQNFEMVESENGNDSLMFKDNWIFGPTEMTFTIKLKTKHNRKTFKKWLMSRGNSRDISEGICQLIGLMKGGVSYETVYLYIWSGGLK